MPRFIVKNTHIKHGAPGAKTAITYAPGDTIELTFEEAKKLGKNVELAGEQIETPAKDIRVAKGPISAMLNPKEPIAATKDPMQEKPDVPEENNAAKAPKTGRGKK